MGAKEGEDAGVAEGWAVLAGPAADLAGITSPMLARAERSMTWVPRSSSSSTSSSASSMRRS
jgi:hypothetical protein